MRAVKEHPFFQEQSYCGHQSDNIGGCQCRHKQAVPNTMHSSSVPIDCHFRRKYLKGLLSIPCDGRGARRPLGQSFRESVGHAALYQVAAANRRDRYMSTQCDVCRGTC